MKVDCIFTRDNIGDGRPLLGGFGFLGSSFGFTLGRCSGRHSDCCQSRNVSITFFHVSFNNKLLPGSFVERCLGSPVSYTLLVKRQSRRRLQIVDRRVRLISWHHVILSRVIIRLLNLCPKLDHYDHTHHLPCRRCEMQYNVGITKSERNRRSERNGVYSRSIRSVAVHDGRLQ